MVSTCCCSKSGAEKEKCEPAIGKAEKCMDDDCKCESVCLCGDNCGCVDCKAEKKPEYKKEKDAKKMVVSI